MRGGASDGRQGAPHASRTRVHAVAASIRAVGHGQGGGRWFLPLLPHLTYAEAKAEWKAAWLPANFWTVCKHAAQGDMGRGVNAMQGMPCHVAGTRRAEQAGWDVHAAMLPCAQCPALCCRSVRHGAGKHTGRVRGSRSTLSVRNAAVPVSTRLK